MPKQVQKAEVNSFLGGLITEASALNFPPNAASDLVNLELNRDGMISRRLGMDFEPGYTTASTGYQVSDVGNIGFNSFKWETVGGDPNKNYIVFQVGQNLILYNADVINFTGSGPVATIALTEFDASKVYSMASVEGHMAVVAGSGSIAIVEYNNGFTVKYDRLMTRDLWGIEETINPAAETDKTLRIIDNAQHAYNLQNQSWGIPRKANDATYWDPISYFYAALPDGSTGPNPNYTYIVPSNAEQIWTGLQYQAVGVTSASTQQPFERMYRNLWDDALGAKFESAKGYFIIDALRRGEGRAAAQIANNAKYPQLTRFWQPPSDYTDGGPTAVSEFAGRIFYGGFSGVVIDGDARSPNYSNYLFFSQLIKNSQDLMKCYQEGDPTSRDTSDVVDTDGGFIRISGAQQILALRAIGLSLLVFATNGVWMVTGGTVDSGFSATNFKVAHLSNFSMISINSLIIEGDRAFFWANDGIYMVSRNQLGDFTVDSITLKTIQKFYQNIPNLSKINSYGAYDEVNKKLRWIYQIGTPFGTDQVTHELILDTALNAFSHNIISNDTANSTYVSCLFQTRVTASTTVDANVLVGSDLVVEDSTQVVVGGASLVSNVQYIRYFTLVDVGGELKVTVSYYYNTNWRDWYTVDSVGVDAAAYLLTGAVTGGDSSVNKQVPYLTLSFIRTENGSDTDGTPLYQSSCLYRCQWGFSNDISSNRWSTEQQGYRYRKINSMSGGPYDTGFEVLQTKNKVRGSGKAFSIHLASEPYKDLRLLGWAISMTVNSLA